ncbi:MAG TPA: hypothetical protein PLL53_21820, partial [Saprospiraceae bacterium]|nr:hypothetical protein [Saprospiraceae bacterium]
KRDGAIALLKDGIGKIPASKGAFSLYILCAELLYQEKRQEEAIQLLESGIHGGVPPEYNATALYYNLSYYYFLNKQAAKALQVLDDGISNIPLQYGQKKLHDTKCHQLYALSDADGLQGINNNAPPSSYCLSRVLTCFLTNDHEQGVNMAASYNSMGAQDAPLISQHVMGLLVLGRTDDAWKLFTTKLDESYNEATAWLYTLAAGLRNDQAAAQKGMKLLAKETMSTATVIEVKDLVRYWWDTRRKSGAYPYLFYPHLPASITGFNRQLSFFSPTIESDLEEYFHLMDNSSQTEAVMDKQTIQSLISKNRIEEAINALKNALSDATPVVSLETQWNQLKSDDIMGVLSYSEKTQRQNQITSALLKLSNMIGEPAQPNAQPETVSGSHPASEKPKEDRKVVKVFLASSEELLADRDQFEIFLSRENDHLFEKGIRIQLIRWENFLDVVSNTRLQDEYNKVLRTCDMVVCLFYTKVGKYTAEEFDAALGQFRGAGKPHILTYFKDAPVKPSELRAFNTVLEFKDKLSALGHFPNHYESIGDLKHHFGEQLKKLGIS